jgi:N-acetylmuramoyl-L-alanine amidase
MSHDRRTSDAASGLGAGMLLANTGRNCGVRRPYRIAVTFSLIGILFGSVAIGGGGPVGKAPIVVVIDAGHGGEDPGALGIGGGMEKDITLAVARSVALQAVRYPDLNIVLTRVDDHYVELTDRIARAREVRAAVYVSLHANSASDASARGVETYVADGARDAADSEQLAEALQPKVVRATASKDRGVRTASLYISRASMAAVLVEMGFVTAKADMSALQNPSVQAKIASAVLEGISAYLAEE